MKEDEVVDCWMADEGVGGRMRKLRSTESWLEETSLLDASE
jgi:hypothetical protein